VGLTCHAAARLSVGAGERSWVVTPGTRGGRVFWSRTSCGAQLTGKWRWGAPWPSVLLVTGHISFALRFLSFSRWRDTYFHVHVLNRELVYTSPETDRWATDLSNMFEMSIG
jgi:hypothetical protein